MASHVLITRAAFTAATTATVEGWCLGSYLISSPSFCCSSLGPLPVARQPEILRAGGVARLTSTRLCRSCGTFSHAVCDIPESWSSRKLSRGHLWAISLPLGARCVRGAVSIPIFSQGRVAIIIVKVGILGRGSVWVPRSRGMYARRPRRLSYYCDLLSGRIIGGTGSIPRSRRRSDWRRRGRRR